MYVYNFSLIARKMRTVETNKQEAHQLVGHAKRRATEIRPKLVAAFLAILRTSIYADRK